MNAATAVSPLELSALFFVQMAFILAVCRVFARAFARMGQSQVVSEMVAGLFMGPSVMGLVTYHLADKLSPYVAQVWPGHGCPDLSALLFPAQSKPILFAICQLGLVLYMFLVGVDFDLQILKSRLRGAVAVATAGMVVPFALGAIVSLALVHDARMFGPGTSALQGLLFMGAAMSITAFPMLARLVAEQGLTRKPLGILALAAGAIDDAGAWCVFAMVIASLQGDPSIVVTTLGGAVLFAVAVFMGLRRTLLPLGRRVEQTGELDHGTLAGVMALVMLSAWITDRIGIHLVFGAFLVGTAMPRGKFTSELQRIMGPLTNAFLLPVFSVYSGLNTKIGMVNSLYLWGMACIILAAAIGGKTVASYAAARASGETHRDSLALGALMNARGMMELMILNMGLERGIIEPALFAIMVLMAILTSMMTTPLFHRIYGPAVAPEPSAVLPFTS